ncbi:uncharacterized protein L203_101267 [Cryptococcus depauperatus CBS 7841]|uniref:Uncharacterized protein n=1 Tax=Cryptococcus depauperatus CBS 7841 TaxID=1295531 RepID=A0AAJ8JPK0_9TREE
MSGNDGNRSDIEVSTTGSENKTSSGSQGPHISLDSILSPSNVFAQGRFKSAQFQLICHGLEIALDPSVGDEGNRGTAASGPSSTTVNPPTTNDNETENGSSA